MRRMAPRFFVGQVPLSSRSILPRVPTIPVTTIALPLAMRKHLIAPQQEEKGFDRNVDSCVIMVSQAPQDTLKQEVIRHNRLLLIKSVNGQYTLGFGLHCIFEDDDACKLSVYKESPIIDPTIVAWLDKHFSVGYYPMSNPKDLPIENLERIATKKADGNKNYFFASDNTIWAERVKYVEKRSPIVVHENADKGVHSNVMMVLQSPDAKLKKEIIQSQRLLVIKSEREGYKLGFGLHNIFEEDTLYKLSSYKECHILHSALISWLDKHFAVGDYPESNPNDLPMEALEQIAQKAASEHDCYYFISPSEIKTIKAQDKISKAQKVEEAPSYDFCLASGERCRLSLEQILPARSYPSALANKRIFDEEARNESKKSVGPSLR